MGGTSFSLSSASDHRHETYFFFFLYVGPGLQTVPQRPKIKPTMSHKKLKTGLGFETLPQSQANNIKEKPGLFNYTTRLN
jgi:hypothetical protein